MRHAQVFIGCLCHKLCFILHSCRRIITEAKVTYPAEAYKDVAGSVYMLAPYHLKAGLSPCIQNNLFWQCLQMASITPSNSFPDLKNTVKRPWLFMKGINEIWRSGVVSLYCSQRQMLNLLAVLLLGRSLAMVPDLSRMAAWIRVSGSSRKGASMEARKAQPGLTCLWCFSLGRRRVAFLGLSRDLCEAYVRKRRERGSRGCILAVQQLHVH